MGSHGMSGAEYLASIYGTEKDKVSDFRDPICLFLAHCLASAFFTFFSAKQKHHFFF
jgi:hypothetical protein